jgi:hypothetical protein
MGVILPELPGLFSSAISGIEDCTYGIITVIMGQSHDSQERRNLIETMKSHRGDGL